MVPGSAGRKVIPRRQDFAPTAATPEVKYTLCVFILIYNLTQLSGGASP
jgi:hypothetical protein